jgi:sugar O-acyltransferase (sialic acid O-acetyltransferase NeuD family)
MKRLAIIGSEDLACQIAHLVVEQKRYQLVGFFDDFKPKGSIVNHLPILGSLDAIQGEFDNKMFDEIIIGIGYKHMEFRSELIDRFIHEIPFGSVIHPNTCIDKTAEIGAGTVIFSGCTIDMHVKIGDNCIFYNGCIIAHDSTISSNTLCSPGVKVAGFCNIGKGVILGIGTIVSDNITITNDVKTGAGTVVVKNINENGLYVGVPAKKIKS